jgi:hypothetical protein
LNSRRSATRASRKLQAHRGSGTAIGDRDFVLLGIKYEAARLGGVDEAALAEIEAQIRAEIGEGWESDAMVLRGRDAVRQEHGHPKIVEPPGPPSDNPDRRPLWRRLLGRRS